MRSFHKERVQQRIVEQTIDASMAQDAEEFVEHDGSAADHRVADYVRACAVVRARILDCNVEHNVHVQGEVEGVIPQQRVQQQVPMNRLLACPCRRWTLHSFHRSSVLLAVDAIVCKKWLK